MNRKLRTASVLALLAALATPLSMDQAQASDVDGDASEGMLGPLTGQQIYEQICAGCHMPDGKGAVGAGAYPAFAGNPRVASPQYLAVTIQGGRRNMPAFSKPERAEGFFVPTWLTERQVAEVINYIRSNFGNKYTDKITAEEVRALRPPLAASK